MMLSPSATVLSRTMHIVGGLVLLFLGVPLLVLIPISFNDSSFFTLPQNGLSWRWYASVIVDPGWRLAAINSLVVAAASTALAASLGTSAGFGIAYLRGRFVALAHAIMLVPLVVPAIVAALAIYIRYNALGLTQTRAGLIFAHATLGLPFVMITTSASLKKYDSRLFFAALSLGANPLRAVRYAVLPSIAPGVLAGVIYAFQASFDESIVSLFLARSDQVTLPRKIFSGMTDNITPAVAVVAIFTTVVSVALLAVFLVLQRAQQIANPMLSSGMPNA
jgi:putative spermidine/putrescine transport system permease protein